MNYYKCNKLSNLKNKDISNLLDEILNINLKYRPILSMDKNTTFASEIEFIIKNEHEKELSKIYKHLKHGWKLEKEPCCCDNIIGYTGHEVISPKLTNTKQRLEQAKYIFELLYNNKAMLCLSCSNHIHYDINILKNKYKYYERFLKFITIYEPIIYKFSCGELNYLRNNITRYCKEIGLDYIITYKNIKNKNIEYLKKKYSDKHNLIRFSNFNTIEIRSTMGTLNPAINQNYILFFYKIFEYVTSDKYDEEFINNKFNNINRKSILIEYNNININDILEICDLIYDNNLDKIYFLKQTLKLYNTDDYKYLNKKLIK